MYTLTIIIRTRTFVRTTHTSRKDHKLCNYITVVRGNVVLILNDSVLRYTCIAARFDVKQSTNCIWHARAFGRQIGGDNPTWFRGTGGSGCTYVIAQWRGRLQATMSHTRRIAAGYASSGGGRDFSVGDCSCSISSPRRIAFILYVRTKIPQVFDVAYHNIMYESSSVDNNIGTRWVDMRIYYNTSTAFAAATSRERRNGTV